MVGSVKVESNTLKIVLKVKKVFNSKCDIQIFFSTSIFALLNIRDIKTFELKKTSHQHEFAVKTIIKTKYRIISDAEQCNNFH